MQEDLEQRTVSVSIQAAKLSGRVLRAAIAAVLQKMEQERTMPKVGRNSMKRLTYKDPGANTIEVSGRIRSFERYARKHQVRYHIEKELGTDPPKWTVYFKANQADALTAAFKEIAETVIVPAIQNVETQAKRQADKNEQTIVEIGGRTITDAVREQKSRNGFSFQPT